MCQRCHQADPRPITNLTASQRFMLRLICAAVPTDESHPVAWAEIWSSWTNARPGFEGAIQMMNFDRTGDSLRRRGLIVDDDGDLAPTTKGRDVNAEVPT